MKPRFLFLQEPPKAGYSGGQRIHHRLIAELSEGAEVIFPDPVALRPPGGTIWNRTMGRARHARSLARHLVELKPDVVFMDFYWFRSYGPALLHLPESLSVILYVQSPEALLRGDSMEQRFAPWFYSKNPVRLWWYHVLARKLFHKATTVLALGPWLTRFVAGIGCPSTKIITTGGGLAFSSTAPDVAVEKPNAPRWMATGYVDPYKGTHRLIEALALLSKEECPVVDWYGQTEHNPAYFSWCQERLKEVGRERNLRFHGWVDRETMEAAWREHDVFVSVAPHEGYGLVFGEALAHGLYLLGPQGSTAEDFIVPYSNGRLFEAESASDLAGAIRDAGDTAMMVSKAKRVVLTNKTMVRHEALPSPAQAVRETMGW